MFPFGIILARQVVGQPLVVLMGISAVDRFPFHNETVHFTIKILADRLFLGVKGFVRPCDEFFSIALPAHEFGIFLAEVGEVDIKIGGCRVALPR